MCHFLCHVHLDLQGLHWDDEIMESAQKTKKWNVMLHRKTETKQHYVTRKNATPRNTSKDLFYLPVASGEGDGRDPSSPLEFFLLIWCCVCEEK